MDSTNQKFSFEIISEPSDAAAGSMVSEKCEHVYNKRTCEDATISPAVINREIVEVNEENGWIIVGGEETDAQQIDGISSNQRPMTESSIHIHEYQALRSLNEDSMTENVEASQTCLLNQSSYSHLGSVQIEKQNEYSFDATAAVSPEPVLKEARIDPEAFLHHGIHRRSLQLEDTPYSVMSNSGAPKSPLETPCTAIKGKETEKIQPPYVQSRNNTVNIPKPSGIGLHLNSIINVMQAGSGAIVHTKSAQTFNFSIRGKKSSPTVNAPLSDTPKSPSVFTPLENVSACSEDSGPDIHASAAVNSVTSLSTVIIDSSNNPVDDQSTQANKSLSTNLKNDGISEEFKSNPPKKRKRSSDSSDGCKRCHCRKSKCLKLYCDCFAAGLYCAGSCACQGCYNRPEYEDKVLESRQLIESRNPLAFAPKIVKHITEPPASSPGNFLQDDETQITPSSARHMRGCNCKKSMCLKKYCECYHANVGCSDGCRCEGCKNVFGQKGEYSLDTDVLSKEGPTEITDASCLESMPSGLCHSELTPRTPVVQFKKDVREGSLRPRQCFQSPESGVTFATPISMRKPMAPSSPMNSYNNAMVSEAAQEVLEVSSEEYYGNVETREFSTLHHQTGKTGNLARTNQYSPAGSLSLLRSPGTPMAQSGSSRPLKVIDLDGELSNPMQDDTPDILKDSPAPLNAVKSSSPNKKRVSPPHALGHEFGLRSLNGLRSGRKFILKAVPSVPPVTPSMDSRRGAPQERNGPRQP